VLTKIQNPKFIPTETDVEECEKINEHFGLKRFYMQIDEIILGMNFIKEFKDFNVQFDKNYLILFYVFPLSEFRNHVKIKETKEELRRIRNHPSFKNTILVNIFTNKKEFLKKLKDESNSKEINDSIEDRLKDLFLDKENPLNIQEEFDEEITTEEQVELVKKILSKFKQNSFDFGKFSKPKNLKVLLLGTSEVGKSTIFKKCEMRFSLDQKMNPLLKNVIASDFLACNIRAVKKSMSILKYDQDVNFMNRFPIIKQIMSDNWNILEVSQFYQKDELLVNHLMKDPNFIEIIENNHRYKLSDCHYFLFQQYNEINEKIKNGEIGLEDNLKVYRQSSGLHNRPIYVKGNTVSLFDSGNVQMTKKRWKKS
jgi:hypothetical protein